MRQLVPDRCAQGELVIDCCAQGAVVPLTKEARLFGCSFAANFVASCASTILRFMKMSGHACKQLRLTRRRLHVCDGACHIAACTIQPLACFNRQELNRPALAMGRAVHGSSIIVILACIDNGMEGSGDFGSSGCLHRVETEKWFAVSCFRHTRGLSREVWLRTSIKRFWMGWDESKL